MIKYQLKNGLRVVIEKIPTCRSVAFGIWVKTGSRNESAQNNGISHFIEHMLFKGTVRHSAKEIAEIFDGIGGNVNAFTSKEYTCYYAKVLDEHLPIAVDVLSDMFFNSVFDKQELEKEKNVIFEEISMYEDTPDDLVHDLVARASYGEHSLGRTILGTEETLSAMNPDDLRAYMEQFYNIENTVISIAGNIDDKVIQLIEKHFGEFTNSGSPTSYTTPEFVGDLIFEEKKAEQNHICMSLPGMALEEDNLYPMVLLNNALGGGMSSRLFQEIREKRGLAYSVYSYHSSHMDTGLFTIYTGTAPKQTEEVLKVTMDILENVKEHGLTDLELKKGKEQLKGSLILSLESTNSRMNRLGKNELIFGKHYSLDEMIERIESVNMDHIRSLVGRLFARPFALSMVGSSNEALHHFRRDLLV
ncbi:M16 family metallopeptidase [Paenibacillus larvae]|uniref:Specific processing protease-like protein n=2 Tax=Paenibacillus larvae subsp. larvae TaxID=147375 RepID=V9W4F3_9BACL|nr:pitrilysin family protein [Paenibacillus larvae]AHD05906.1 specific processing protease-like protein [Paenibacillus larvae subsp. larvae DSM 25430]AVG12443.1 specific processing protease-like protein [Paenibacillus larvae subsp. larvae DSM 25430]MDR5569534.1 pitrilysin family protein [Paenibacillus larvae]MDR5596180.1 pitrilysin family protein [Paenibacillus larvae]QHZ51570.1 specific processing protease-like protein [Paenibacillus larvae subsp. larvae]